MRQLILIKHSIPDLDAAIPWHEWHLSAQGRKLCEPLADRLAAYEPAAIISSTETKAIETAELAADRLGISSSVQDGLQENDRTGLGIVPQEDLCALIAEFFRRPDEVVIGRETADQALCRFAAAIEEIIDRQPEGNIVTVAHGTVITLFVSAHNDIEPYPFWRSLGLPSFVVLSLPGFGLDSLHGGNA